MGVPGSTFPVNFNMLPSPNVIPAFKFQLRRDTIDWRRFSAIDVDRVARELDLATLQDNINSVTFCNLDAEKCPYCQQPVDPVLLKVLKMAQLTIEYLLHSQEYLSMNLTAQEQHHQAALEDLKRLQQELDKQAEEIKSVKEESRRRKKMIATQQLLLQAGANNYHKCQLCDKTFMNYSFLQAHMQRRHPEATAAEKEKKKQVVQMENEIDELKVKLKETQVLLEAESQHRAQEAENIRQREEEERRKFERWKEEERTKFQKEMEDLRQLFLSEFKDISSRNSVLEEKLHELQIKNAVVSNLGTLQDDESIDKQQWSKTQRELQGMKAKIEQQKAEWKWKLKELQKEYQNEKEELKNENERLRASLSSDQWKMAEQSKQQMGSLTAQLREQAKIIQTQEKTIKLLSSSKAREIQEVPKTDKPEESTEEELEDAVDKKKRVLEALRRNPNLLKQFRPILEETLEEKLENMGVKRGTKGVPAQTYKHLRDIVKVQQQQKAQKFPRLLALRDKLQLEVKKRISLGQMEERDLSVAFSAGPGRRQMSPHSPFQVKSSKPRMQQVELQPYASEMPKPAPRSKVISVTSMMEMPKFSSPKQAKISPPSSQHSPIHQPSTSPFTSEEEESEEEQTFASPKFTPFKTEPELPRVTQKEESDWDSSDTNSLEERGKMGRILSPAAPAHSETWVQSMAKNLEGTLSTPGRKPAGGVKLFPTETKEAPKSNHSSKKLQFVDEDSDLDISSLEEVSQHLDTESKLKQQQSATASGDLSVSRATTIWSSSSTRAAAW
uniref:Cilium assembly protein DZIP1L isoform X1 n=2 Tax=Pogona vitticeps TaxID=103695 RepID=A0A6J0VFJ1_9SAUR